MIEVKDIPYSSLVESALTELRDPSNRERTAGELHGYLDAKYPGWWDRYTEEFEALKKRLLTPEIPDTEAEVCKDILERKKLGIAKYGTTVAENPLSELEWLTHAYQEATDLAVYLKRLIQEKTRKP